MKCIYSGFCSVLLFGFAAASSSAAVLQVTGGGVLTGANDVVVNGVLYDVVFEDSTCVDAYSGCNGDPGDFAFSTSNGAQFASQALLDQVFIDGLQGNFDTNHELVFGCGYFAQCTTHTPYLLSGARVDSSTAQNADGSPGFNPDLVAFGGWGTTFDLSTTDAHNYAVWTLAPSEVPVPPAAFLLGSALTGLMCFGRRHRKTS